MGGEGLDACPSAPAACAPCRGRPPTARPSRACRGWLSGRIASRSPAAMALVRSISSCIGRLIVRSEHEGDQQRRAEHGDRREHDLAALAVEMLDDVAGRPRQIDGAGDAAVDDDRHARRRRGRRCRGSPNRAAAPAASESPLAKHAGIAAGKCCAHLLDMRERAADIARRRRSPCRRDRAAGSRRAWSAGCRPERAESRAPIAAKAGSGVAGSGSRPRLEHASTARSRLGSIGR